MTVNTIVVGDEAALLRALSAATGETVIQLKAGVYDRFTINSINPTGKVTITSFDPANKTEIDTMTVKASSNLVFQDLYFHHVESTNYSAGLQVRVSGSNNITFLRNEFAGTVDANNLNDVGGLQVNDSSRVSILNNEFHDLRVATYSYNSNHLVIAGNEVTKAREGMDFANVDHVTIDRNSFSQFAPATGDHADGIQFWTTNSTGSTNVEITNNAFMFGGGTAVQGIFIRSEMGDVARHSDFVIANNVYQGSSRHGITVYDADGVQITGNTVVSAPKIGSAVYLDPAINTKNTTGVEIDHNVAALRFSTADIGLAAHDNIDAWDLQTGVGVRYADLFGADPTSTAQPGDFLIGASSSAGLIGAGYAEVDTTGNWSGVSDAWMGKYAAMLDVAGNSYFIP